MPTLLVALAVLGLGVVLYWAWLLPGPAAGQATPVASQQVNATPLAQPVTHRPASTARANGLTDRNTVFRTDAAGQLVIDAGVAQRLQALVDTLPPQYSLRQLEVVEDAVREGLPGPLALQALQLLHQYIGYTGVQARLLVQPRAGDGLAAAQQRLEALVALRRRHFGEPTAQALFGEEEAQDHSTIERLRLARSP